MCKSPYSIVNDITHLPSYKITRNESFINTDVNLRLKKALIFYYGDKVTGFLAISCTNAKYLPVFLEALQSTDFRLFLWLDVLETWKCRQLS